MRKRRRSSKRDPTTALINIVFLILIFFMVAGSLSAPVGPSVKFVQTSDLDCCVSPDALVISTQGAMFLGGAPVASPRDYAAILAEGGKPARLAPDRDLQAQTLLRIVKELQEAGVGRIIIVTESTSS